MGTTLKDITGQKFGLLTVVGRAPSGADGRVRWNCVCSGGGPRCKGQAVVLSKRLPGGTTKSCGCLSTKSVPPPSPGDMFGRWRLVRAAEPAPGKKARWVCVCSCQEATEKVVDQAALRKGLSKSCGCYKREQTSALISARHEYIAFLSHLRKEAEAEGVAVDF